MSNAAKNEEILYKKKRLRPFELRNLWLSRIFLWVFIIFTLFPIVAIISASLAKGQSFSQGGKIFPSVITFENYTNVIKNTDFMIWVKNSLLISFSVAAIQLVITAPAAYAFSRLKFWGRRSGLMGLLILQMFPTIMSLPAILAVAYKLNFMDHLSALILLQCGGSAYNIWLLKGSMDGIPKELDEAAYVDGANSLQTFFRVVLPLTRSMLLVIFVFAFIGSYGEYIMTSALMKDSSTQTIMTGLRQFINNQYSTNWTQFAAAAVMASIPIVIIASFAQKFMAKGLVAGAVKG